MITKGLSTVESFRDIGQMKQNIHNLREVGSRDLFSGMVTRDDDDTLSS